MVRLSDLTPFLFFFGSFSLGLIIGACATWIYFAKKYFLRPIDWRNLLVASVALVVSALMMIVWLIILTSPDAPSERCTSDISYWYCGDAKTPR